MEKIKALRYALFGLSEVKSIFQEKGKTEEAEKAEKALEILQLVLQHEETGEGGLSARDVAAAIINRLKDGSPLDAVIRDVTAEDVKVIEDIITDVVKKLVNTRLLNPETK